MAGQSQDLMDELGAGHAAGLARLLMITRNVSGHTLLTGEYVAGQPPAIARDQLDPTRVDPGASARSQGDDRAAGSQVKCGNPPRFTMSVSRSGCTTTSSSAAKRASTAIGGAVA